jgi:ubiquitin carboxyl-terminal hydrolase 8
MEDHLEKYKDLNGKGVSGLQNLGNTCFMNTSIQCLSHTLPLTYYFLKNNYLEYLNKNKNQSIVVKEWVRLLKGMWEENCTVAPQSFHETIQMQAVHSARETFTGFGQNDCTEFIDFFIDTIHEGLSREVEIEITGKAITALDNMALSAMKQWKKFFKNSYSICVDLFYGQYVSKIMNHEDKNDYSLSYEPFCYLTLPIPIQNNVNIHDCLKSFTKTEMLDGENKWASEKEKKHVKAVKQIMFFSTPKYLIVSFKRMNNNGYKKNCHIDFPIKKLDLEKYCVGYDKYSSKYNLYAICNHSGGLGGGHYWAYCKNLKGEWNEFNDSNIKKKKENEIVTSNAYCLFYEKIIN